MVSESSEVNQLLDLLDQGDEEALGKLFFLYREKLRRMVDFRLDRRLQGRVDVSDVLQEVYIDASQRLEHYRSSPPDSFLLWLRQLTDQRLVDVHRRHFGAQKRDVRRESSKNPRGVSPTTSANLLAHLAGPASSPSQQAIRGERAAAVEEALAAMEPMDREVLALRHFEELTNKEVAEILGIQKTAASNRYIRALARLQKILAAVPGVLDETD